MDIRYTKEELMQAYYNENLKRKSLERSLNKQSMTIAELKHHSELDKRLNLLELVVPDGKSFKVKEEIEKFKHEYRDEKKEVFYVDTGGGGVVIGMVHSDHVWIWFAWGNRWRWRSEAIGFPCALKTIYKHYGLPMYYTGDRNYLKNHSQYIRENVWEVDYNAVMKFCKRFAR